MNVEGKYIFKIDGEEINDLKCAASGMYRTLRIEHYV